METLRVDLMGLGLPDLGSYRPGFASSDFGLVILIHAPTTYVIDMFRLAPAAH
jgi:hypothetical protein